MFRKWFSTNWLALLSAFALSLLLWFYVLGSKSATITFPVPLEVVGETPHMFIKEKPEVVQITVKGPRDVLLGLTAKALKVKAKLEFPTIGKNKIRLSSKNVITTKRGIEVIDVIPEFIVVEIARR